LFFLEIRDCELGNILKLKSNQTIENKTIYVQIKRLQLIYSMIVAIKIQPPDPMVAVSTHAPPHDLGYYNSIHGTDKIEPNF
jgi:hypothetical protein